MSTARTSSSQEPEAQGPVPAREARRPSGQEQSGAFAELARTRPRIRRDVLFTETPGGVLFHNADGGFHLAGKAAYRFASLVVPHLGGQHQLGEICKGFGPAQQAMAATLVGTLYDRDFARDVPPEDPEEPAALLPEAVAERFAAQIGYVDHYVDAARSRFQRFHTTRVAVLGEDDVARWCAVSLLRNGCTDIGLAEGARGAELEEERRSLEADDCPVRLRAVSGGEGWADLEGYDIVVVTGAGAPASARRLLEEGVPEGRTLIPSWSFGARAVTGPLSQHGSTGCWCCALLRFGANVDPAAAADIWSEVAASALPLAGRGGTRDASAVTGPLAAMTGNLLGYEIFRLVTGALPAETDHAVLIQDLESLDVTAEPVQAHPRCRYCADQAEREGDRSAPSQLSLAKSATVETAREAEQVVDELNALGEALVRPHTGVFTRYDDEALTQTPLKLSRVELPLGQGVRRQIAAFDVHHLAGARTRALYTAAETYAARQVPVPAATPRDGERTVGAEQLSTGGLPGEGVVSGWVRATSLLTREPVWVPAAAWQPYGPHNRERALLPGSAGLGAGGTAGDAAGRGLLSALAHDALLRAVRGEGRVALLKGDESSAELAFLLKSADNLGVQVELLDLGEQEHSGAHVVVARESGADAVRWAVGCGLSAEAATCGALRDLVGQAQLAGESAGPVDLGDPLVSDLAPAALAVTAEGAVTEDTSWDALLEALRRRGRDVLHLATTPADLAAGGISTARVLLTREAPDER